MLLADSLFEEFVRASSHLCEDLNAKITENIERLETEYVGIIYGAKGHGKRHTFEFIVSIHTTDKDFTKGEMTAELSVRFVGRPGAFHIDESIDNLRNHDNFLSRWAAYAISKFNAEHNPVNLTSLFNTEQVRVYGIPNLPYPAIAEMRTLLTGLKSHQTETLYVHRFRHIRDNDRYRSFSYAFRVAPLGSEFWILFLDIGGLDSNGNYQYYKEIESIIESVKPKLKIQRDYLDISYGQLDRFLQKNARGYRIYRKSEYDFFEPSEEAFGTSFVRAYRRFRARYEAEEYAEALRDLRALVQDALVAVFDKKRMEIGSTKKDIHNLSYKLIENHHLVESMRSWFDAFSVIANRASHGDYPKDNEIMEHIDAERIMLTFQIGMQLITEIDREIAPDIEL